MKTLLQDIFCDESGATAIEYGLLISLVGIAAAFGMKTFGDALYNQYMVINNNITL